MQCNYNKNGRKQYPHIEYKRMNFILYQIFTQTERLSLSIVLYIDCILLWYSKITTIKFWIRSIRLRIFFESRPMQFPNGMHGIFIFHFFRPLLLSSQWIEFRASFRIYITFLFLVICFNILYMISRNGIFGRTSRQWGSCTMSIVYK